MDAEAQTIEAFVSPNRRDRWTDGLDNARRRRKVLQRLCHHHDWRGELATETRPTGMREEQLRALLEQLTGLGAPSDCHVMSESARHDGRSMPLLEALEGLSDYGCALIICIPGVLAVHLPEAPAPPVLLSRPQRLPGTPFALP